jgi:hypothetical protein
MSSFNWNCPHCERAVTISDERFSSDSHALSIRNSDGLRVIQTEFIVCPNPECGRFTLRATLHAGRVASSGGYVLAAGELQRWALVPGSASRQFPAYIPESIREDYQEACLIRELSPKASATLSRRCLQGILRDFWKVKPARLVDEIEAVRDKVEPIMWDAIDAVRRLGNIGARMESDINVIVDVDPEEAGLLTGLVETLLTEWYVAREERKKRMTAVIAAATGKKTP